MKSLLLCNCLFFYYFSFSISATPLFDKNTQIEKIIAQTMQAFQVPGVAVAIVQNDQVVFSQGFGVSVYDKYYKITPNTLFGIASNTKAMTTALLAKLVDQYKLSWQTKVVDILPEFQLSTSVITHDFTLVDLLSHRSGLGTGAGDLMIWPKSDLTETDIFKGLKYLPQKSGFRSEFAYNNVMYIIAGKLIEQVTGKPWAEYIQHNLFTPLKMHNTYAKHSHLSNKNQIVARPHILVEGKLMTQDSDFLEKFSSAGSVLSNINDMSLWIKALLNLGRLNKLNRLYSEQQAKFIWQPQTLLPVSDSAAQHDKTHFSAYGLGWFLNDFYGLKLVHHSGGILGMVSKVVLIPEKNMGVVILTNQQSNSALNVIYREIFETYLGLPEKDWLNHYHRKEKRLLAREVKRLNKIEDKMVQYSVPLLPLKHYAQTYTDKWYGDINITLCENKLIMLFSHTPDLKGEMVHYQGNTFIVRWGNRALEADAFVTFTVDENGVIRFATMKAVSYLTDFSFDFHDLKLVPKSS